MPFRYSYAAAGFVLALGAPAGALLLRVVWMPQVRVSPATDIRLHAFFYAYSLIATALVFAVAGYVTGMRTEKLQAAENFYHQLADHDPLTGLLNARAFDDLCRRVVQRVRKTQSKVALLLIDVDRLKEINDSFGHRQGNAALLHVARAIRAAKRTTDVASRWGGDEFAILLENGTEEAARRTATSIMSWLEANTEGTAKVTVTIGVAVGVPSDPEMLFSAADEALYAGKRAGRRQVQLVFVDAEAKVAAGGR